MSAAQDAARMRRPLSIPIDRTALILIDLQEEHRADPRYVVEDYDRILGNCARLLSAARAAAVPVRHFAYIVDLDDPTTRPFHPLTAEGRSAFSDRDDPLTAICTEVFPLEGEPVVVKNEASAFGRGLAPDLKSKGIEWLVIAGVWTEACVDATVKDAITNGFHVVLVKDACGSATPDMHAMGLLNLANRLYGGAIVDTERAVGLLSGGRVEAWQVEGAVPLRITFETAKDLFAAL